MGEEASMTTAGIDSAKLQDFAGRMARMLETAALQRMVSLGYTTGLLKTMAGLPNATSGEIARAASLKERYVREWLGAMVTGGIVEYDRERKAFTLPTEHAMILNGDAGPSMAGFSNYLSLAGSTEEEIAVCFREGGGITYDRVPGATDLICNLTARPAAEARLVSHVLPIVPGLPERLDAGIDVVDVGCGLGYHINLMASAYPQSRFLGLDFRDEALERARAQATDLGLANTRFEHLDVADIGSQECDLVTTFDVIHDLAQPERVLRAVRRILRPKGVFLMVDIGASSELGDNLERPMATLGYTISLMRCMSLSLGQGGPGLGSMWGEQKALEMLREAGFSSISVEQVEGDGTNNYYVVGK
jgi:ubiquinone/menaquinone biosynthesis C-methylase UbiE